MLTHKSFFEGQVQSVGFERNGRRQSAGVIDVGEFHFGTDAPERMHVLSGEYEMAVDVEHHRAVLAHLDGDRPWAGADEPTLETAPNRRFRLRGRR